MTDDEKTLARDIARKALLTYRSKTLLIAPGDVYFEHRGEAYGCAIGAYVLYERLYNDTEPLNEMNRRAYEVFDTILGNVEYGHIKGNGSVFGLAFDDAFYGRAMSKSSSPSYHVGYRVGRAVRLWAKLANQRVGSPYRA